MTKPTSLPMELTPSEREEVVSYAREHLMAAAVILKTLGPSLARVGWMVEDTLVYLDQSVSLGEGEEVFDDVQVPAEETQLNSMDVNSMDSARGDLAQAG